MLHRTMCNLDSVNQSEFLNARDAATLVIAIRLFDRETILTRWK